MLATGLSMSFNNHQTNPSPASPAVPSVPALESSATPYSRNAIAGTVQIRVKYSAHPFASKTMLIASTNLSCRLNIPHYSDVITKLMDFSMVDKKLAVSNPARKVEPATAASANEPRYDGVLEISNSYLIIVTFLMGTIILCSDVRNS
jgi:hypothetical protein